MAWLDGWAYRIKLIIDHTSVDDTLTWFPIYVNISAASGISATDITRVFDELGAESLKIAFTKADGITELYAEVVSWDEVGETAEIWVHRDGWAISDTADTVLYLYYDSTHADNNTYIGVTGSAPAEAVWDAVTVFRSSMSDNPDTSHIMDSTSNDNDGTKTGAGTPTEVPGKIGKGQDFAGVDEVITIADAVSIQDIFAGGGAIHAVINPDSDGENSQGRIVAKRAAGAGWQLEVTSEAAGYVKLEFEVEFSSGTDGKWETTSAVIPLGVFTDISVIYDSDNVANNPTFIINGTAYTVGSGITKTQTPIGAYLTDVGQNLRIGDTNISNGCFDGIIDEVELYNAARSAAWLKATYYTCWDTLIIYLIEDSPDFPAAGTCLTRIAFASDPLETTPVWDYITQVREIHTQRGRNHELDRMEAGTMDIVLDNQSGDFWPDNGGGAYSPNVDTMKKVNVRAIYDGTIYDVFTGYIESFEPGWLSEKGGFGSLMTLRCVGILGKIVSLQVLNNAGYASEADGTRVDNVLDDCGIPVAWIDSDAGDYNLQATGAIVNVNALEHLQAVQETSLSLLYELPDGTLIYESRGHRNAGAHLVSQAIFGEDGGVEIPYISFVYVKDEVLLFNDVRITRTGGTEQVVTNGASQTAYGVRSYVKTGTLHDTDIMVWSTANFLCTRYAVPFGRVESMIIIPDETAKWEQVFIREISDRITFRNNAAGIDKDYFIEAVKHDWIFTSPQSFQTQYQLSDATQYLNPPDAIDETLSVNGAGDATNLLPSAGANWQCVAAAGGGYVFPPNLTTTYDLYALPSSVYGIGTINSVTIYASLKNSGVGDVPQTRIACKTEGVIHYGDNVGASLTGTYAYFTKAYTLNPETGLAWTWAEITALQIGIELTSPVDGNKSLCDYEYVIVNFTPTW